MTKIAQLRKYYGLIQEDFAEKCNVGYTTIQGIEKGKRTRVTTAKLVADYLELPISDLFITCLEPRYMIPIHVL